MQTLAADVQGLRKGLDLAKNERDKQPNNFIIYVSFLLCFEKRRDVRREKKKEGERMDGKVGNKVKGRRLKKKRKR